MNKLSTKLLYNAFSKLNYSIIEVDGKPLGEMVEELSRNKMHSQLVPTLLNWLGNPWERCVVWKRILPAVGETVNAPILMCSEDVDLWCDLIHVRVKREQDYVMWEDIGIESHNPRTDLSLGKENSDFTDIQNIGYSVYWLKTGPLKFTLENYIDILTHFKECKYLN